MPVSIYCPHCHQRTALSTGLNDKRQAADWLSLDGRIRWWIGVCNGCGQPCLVGNEGAIIYPHARPSPTDTSIPDDLRKDLDEGKLCFSVNCFRAAAVMARRCVQQACIVKGCNNNANLVEQIAQLKQAGHITKDIAEWATVVRWIGNDAAHPGGDPVGKEDAKDCLELAEQFLHVLFVTPALAQSRRGHRGK
jgi:uncharacterized protein DUF4145